MPTFLAKAFGEFGMAEVSRDRRAVIKKQRANAFEFLIDTGQFVRREGDRIARLFGSEIASLAAILGEHLKTLKLSPGQFSTIQGVLEPIVNLLVPGYATLHGRLERAWNLRLQLLRCPPGTRIGALTKIFVSGFSVSFSSLHSGT